MRSGRHMTIIERLQAISDIIEPDGMILGGIWSGLQGIANGHIPDVMVQPTYDKIDQAMSELSDHLFRVTRYPEVPDDEWAVMCANRDAAIASGEIPF